MYIYIYNIYILCRYIYNLQLYRYIYIYVGSQLDQIIPESSPGTAGALSAFDEADQQLPLGLQEPGIMTVNRMGS